MFEREISNHMYTSSAYYLANVVSIFVTLWVHPVIGGTVVFYFFKLEADSFGDLMYYLAGLLMISLCGRMLGLAVGCAFKEPLLAMQVGGLFCMILTDTGGCFANVGSGASHIVKTLSYISPVRYSAEI